MDYDLILGRDKSLFASDLSKCDETLRNIVQRSSFLIIGGGGSIGQAVTKEIFLRNPELLHVVDISENSLVELVRDIRSTMGYISGEFKTFAIDCGGVEYEALTNQVKYDYVLNLSALKHVRSERDPFTLMRLIEVNILNTIKTHRIANEGGSCKYFCVSTDKAANPVNMMGASKKIMEMFLMRESEFLDISTARFANVAFSDGSLLHGFNQRFIKKQPFSAPKDIKRYFISPKESGELCLMSCIFGENRDIYFPKLIPDLHLIRFDDLAVKYLEASGYEPYECDSEEEARRKVNELIKENKWPCYFFDSDTTGEKSFEEFYTDNETLDLDRYEGLGVIKNEANYDARKLDSFLVEIERLREFKCWDKQALVKIFEYLIHDFKHYEKGKYLDARM